VTIVLLAEGRTEMALRGPLKDFLDALATVERRPKVALHIKDIMTLNEGKLRARIRNELAETSVTAVVGLIDVYPSFASAAEAKGFLRRAAGEDARFHAHAAQYDVEAWLLPYWADICRRLGLRTRAAPGGQPEMVNRVRPPSVRLAELYRLAQPPRKYTKPIELAAILKGKDLTIAAAQCAELKALLNTLLGLGGLQQLP
jgi:hypothetical protein